MRGFACAAAADQSPRCRTFVCQLSRGMWCVRPDIRSTRSAPRLAAVAVSRRGSRSSAPAYAGLFGAAPRHVEEGLVVETVARRSRLLRVGSSATVCTESRCPRRPSAGAALSSGWPIAARALALRKGGSHRWRLPMAATPSAPTRRMAWRWYSVSLSVSSPPRARNTSFRRAPARFMPSSASRMQPRAATLGDRAGEHRRIRRSPGRHRSARGTAPFLRAARRRGRACPLDHHHVGAFGQIPTHFPGASSEFAGSIW